MTVDDVIEPLSDPTRESPVWMRSRLVGKPLRAVAIALGGLAVVAGGFSLLVWTSHGGAFPNVWTWTSGLVIGMGGGLVAMAINEARRPLWRVGSRTFGRGIRRDGAPTWHPRIAGPVDEYRRTTHLNEAHVAPPLWLLAQLVREGLSPRVKARLVFDDAPFRRGAIARMTFSASAARRTIDGERISFHLRCFEESPDAVLPKRGIRCIAELTPSRRRDTYGSTFTSELEFGIPSSVPDSDVEAREPRYWVLTVAIGGLDGRYREEFFVPVEARPSTSGVARVTT